MILGSRLLGGFLKLRLESKVHLCGLDSFFHDVKPLAYLFSLANVKTEAVKCKRPAKVLETPWRA